MNKKTAFQTGLLVLLAVGAVFWLEGFFKPEKIQILCDIHPSRIIKKNARADDSPGFDIAFGFDLRCTLTAVKIVALDEWTTNKQAQPLWHLVSTSNSVPTKAIIYGRWVGGMHPAVPGVHAGLLQPNVAYRLMIEAGSRTGECDFKLPVAAAR